MFENIKNIFKKARKKEILRSNSKDTAKERLHLVLMQDRANVSADFLDLMRKEIIEVIKKYIDIDEDAMDVRLTTETSEEGLQGAPALYANIPIINIKDETRKLSKTNQDKNIITEEKAQEQEDKENPKEATKEEKEKETPEEPVQNDNIDNKENADQKDLKQEKNKNIEEEKKNNEE